MGRKGVETLVGVFVLLGLIAVVFLALKAANLASFQGRVTMELDAKVQFPADTSAKILTSGLLGDQYVGLEPGGSDKNLGSGDQIRMTQSAVVLENLIGQFLYNKAAEGGDKK
jgi:phospholipid/cholesterol/gamma-HCH transport system substrate-binding protein